MAILAEAIVGRLATVVGAAGGAVAESCGVTRQPLPYQLIDTDSLCLSQGS